jgi:hypothetical protein
MVKIRFAVLASTVTLAGLLGTPASGPWSYRPSTRRWLCCRGIVGQMLGKADALLAAWFPGAEGDGVADILFGGYKPAGKLSFSWPAIQIWLWIELLI